MAPSRAVKRIRAEDQCSFWENDDDGVYLVIKLKSGKSLKSRGWPWVQHSVRGILGDRDKLSKASFQNDGSLLVKTKSVTQTEKLMKAQSFGAEVCTVEKEGRLNTSRGTIHAFDLVDLSEDEIVQWLADFGVVGAKRFTRLVNGQRKNTPTVLVTFDKPTCPNRLDFDYVSYHVRPYIPNPLICHKCGKFGHAEMRRRAEEATCLTCSKTKHEGPCTPKCVNCGATGHTCRSRECPIWGKEREICKLKVEKDISYAHARREYELAHQTPVIRPYASVVRSQTAPQGQDTGAATGLQDRVEKLEEKVDKMISLLNKLLERQTETPAIPVVQNIRNQHTEPQTETDKDTDTICPPPSDTICPPTKTPSARLWRPRPPSARVWRPGPPPTRLWRSGPPSARL